MQLDERRVAEAMAKLLKAQEVGNYEFINDEYRRRESVGTKKTKVN